MCIRFHQLCNLLKSSFTAMKVEVEIHSKHLYRTLCSLHNVQCTSDTLDCTLQLLRNSATAQLCTMDETAPRLSCSVRLSFHTGLHMQCTLLHITLPYHQCTFAAQFSPTTAPMQASVQVYHSAQSTGCRLQRAQTLAA